MDAPEIHLAFASSVGLLLALPGPTNAIVFNAGLKHGLRAIPATVPAVAAGYFIALSILLAGLQQFLVDSPLLFRAMRLLCSGYLLYVALKLWRPRPEEADGKKVQVNVAKDTLLITMLNPKSIIVAITIIPLFFGSGNLQMSKAAPILLTVSLVGAAICFAYTILGALTVGGRGSDQSHLILSRLNALVILGFAFWIALS
jgi:threonine/homoserine/homoserine lactone efflux protein